MNAVYFGSSLQPLYGAYEPPKVRRQPTAGVVLCAPMGQEYMRAHKAMRQLAAQLARTGFHVLRFDYFGTGDSAGLCEEGSVEQWLTDIDTAVEEMKDTSGVTQVSLVGLRMGGTLAAAAAARRDDVDALVLWDPIVTGSSYTSQMISLAVRGDGSGRPLAGNPAPGETVSVRGFPLTPTLRAGLATLDIATMAARARRNFLVVSEEQPDYARLKDSLQGQSAPLSYALIPSASSWESASSSGGDLVAGAMVLPQQMIQGIVGWFGQETPG